MCSHCLMFSILSFSEPRKKVKKSAGRIWAAPQTSGPSGPAPANAELEMTAPSLIQPLGVVPLLASPLSTSSAVILPQTPSGSSYAIYFAACAGFKLSRHPGPEPHGHPPPLLTLWDQKDSTDATGENADSDAPKVQCIHQAWKLLQSQRDKVQEPREASWRKGSRGGHARGQWLQKKFKEDLKAPENVSTVSTAINCAKL